MRLGYNTNGFAHHSLLDAMDVLAELGYQSVAITLDHHALNPYDDRCRQHVELVCERLKKHRMHSVIETGARFLLDPRIKHEPTLVSAESAARARRIDFLRRAVDMAEALHSDCISFWSGVVRDEASADQVWNRFLPSLREVLDYAAQRRVAVGFEPEPGMFIDTMKKFQELLDRVGRAELQLTLDVGHLHCLGETPLQDSIRSWGDRLVNVHLEDMRAGVHEHLMFGDGEIDFAPVFAGFRDVGYAGGVHVELSRLSHQAPQAAAQAKAFLQPWA